MQPFMPFFGVINLTRGFFIAMPTTDSINVYGDITSALGGFLGMVRDSAASGCRKKTDGLMAAFARSRYIGVDGQSVGD